MQKLPPSQVSEKISKGWMGEDAALLWEFPGPNHHSTGPWLMVHGILQASGWVMAPALEKLTAPTKPDPGEHKQGGSPPGSNTRPKQRR